MSVIISHNYAYMYEQNMYIHDQFSILILKKKVGKGSFR